MVIALCVCLYAARCVKCRSEICGDYLADYATYENVLLTWDERRFRIFSSVHACKNIPRVNICLFNVHRSRADLNRGLL